MNDKAAEKPALSDLMNDAEANDFYDLLTTELKIQRNNYLIVFSLIITALLAGLVYLGFRNYTLEKAYDDQIAVSSNLKKERDKAMKDVIALRANADTLLKNKIPGLHAFEFNNDIEIDEKYVSRISFDKAGSKSDQGEGYQVRLTLLNKTESTVMPDFNLILFDSTGMVIDHLHVSTMGDSFIRSGAIKPNEGRTDISGILRITDPSKKPAYFAVKAR